MAITELSRELPPIQIGERLRSKLWIEAIKIAQQHERTPDYHQRRRLQAQFNALFDLLVNSCPRYRQ